MRRKLKSFKKWQQSGSSSSESQWNYVIQIKRRIKNETLMNFVKFCIVEPN